MILYKLITILFAVNHHSWLNNNQWRQSHSIMKPIKIPQHHHKKHSNIKKNSSKRKKKNLQQRRRKEKRDRIRTRREDMNTEIKLIEMLLYWRKILSQSECIEWEISVMMFRILAGMKVIWRTLMECRSSSKGLIITRNFLRWW